MTKHETIGTVLIILFMPFFIFLAAIVMSYLYLALDRPETQLPHVTGSPCMHRIFTQHSDKNANERGVGG